MIPTAEQFQAQVRKSLQTQVAWIRDFFNLPTCNPNLKILDSDVSLLGMATINSLLDQTIRITSFQFTRFEVLGVSEYARYAARPVIGSFKTNDWVLAVDTLIAHELAHVVQFMIKRTEFGHPWRKAENYTHFGKDGVELGSFEDGHGSFFRRIYRLFRIQFINDRIQPGAYAPRLTEQFARGAWLEEALDMIDTPLKGIEIVTPRHPKGLVIAGRNPKKTATLYRYYVRTATGELRRIKLSLLAQMSEKVREVIRNDPALSLEYAEHMIQLKTKAAANRKSSQTKRQTSYFQKMRGNAA